MTGRPLSVLRICSVFQPPPDLALDPVAGFDPIGGMQTHTSELTRALDVLGVRQTVVTARLPGAPRRERLGARTEVLRLGWPIRRLRGLYSLPAVPHVMGAAARSDVVHVHLGEDIAAIPLGMAAARIHHLPLVLTIHCSLRYTFAGAGPRGRLLRSLGAQLESVGCRRASAVIVLTERLARALDPEVGGHRLRVIPSGVNREMFHSRYEDPFPDVPRPRVVFVGRLAGQKGVLRLIRAVPMLPSDASVVLVGDGPERSRVEEQIEATRLRQRVFVTGFVHHDRVPAYLSHTDVLVLPSVYEELGAVLIEAMEAGVAIVANDTGGISEVIRHGENGLLCRAEDPHSLARAISTVLRDPELRRRLSAGAKASSSRYDWKQLAEEVLSLYGEVASTPPLASVGGTRG